MKTHKLPLLFTAFALVCILILLLSGASTGFKSWKCYVWCCDCENVLKKKGH